MTAQNASRESTLHVRWIGARAESPGRAKHSHYRKTDRNRGRGKRNSADPSGRVTAGRLRHQSS